MELVFGEFSQLDAPPQKHCDDWEKLVRSCKDSIDMLRDVCFYQVDIGEADSIVRSFNGIPIIAILTVRTHIKVSVIDSFNGKFYKAYEIMDIEIPLKPAGRQEIEDIIRKAL